VIAVHDLAWGNAFLLSAYGNRGTMGIRAGNHQHVVATQTMIAGKDVGGEVCAGYVTNVHIAVAIRPGNAD